MDKVGQNVKMHIAASSRYLKLGAAFLHVVSNYIRAKLLVCQYFWIWSRILDKSRHTLQIPRNKVGCCSVQLDSGCNIVYPILSY